MKMRTFICLNNFFIISFTLDKSRKKYYSFQNNILPSHQSTPISVNKKKASFVTLNTNSLVMNVIQIEIDNYVKSSQSL